MPTISGDLKGVKEITACANKTVDLYFALEHLKFGHGRKVILDRFEEWREICKIRSDDVFVPKKLINDAIADLDRGEHELAEKQLETAQKQVMREAIIQISRAK